VFGIKGEVPCLLDDVVVTTDPFAITFPATWLIIR
jgi:hypothetical protein